MYVMGLGDVTQVSNTTIFFKDEDGSQQKKKVNEEDLGRIHGTAWENVAFYDRAYRELHELYEKRRVEYDKKYHFITDEEIEAEFKANGRSKKWFDMSISKDSHNEECRYQWGKVAGISEACSEVSEKKWEADRIYRQVQGVYQYLVKSHVVVHGNKKRLVSGKKIGIKEAN